MFELLLFQIKVEYNVRTTVVPNKGRMVLIYITCVCLRIVMCNTYCVVFLFCFFSSCVPYVASFSGLSIFDCPFGIL